MHIAYVANHGQVGTSNDDEGAIAYALKQLGHTVIPIQQLLLSVRDKIEASEAELVLFHHWDSIDIINQIKIPKAFWSFDLIGSSKDRSVEWVKALSDTCLCGFLTDGSYIEKHNQENVSSNLHWLMQGFDSRQRIRSQNIVSGQILFTGLLHDQKRKNMCDVLRYQYRDKFIHHPCRLYGNNLVSVIQRANVVIAPPSPIRDNYWSNRVYLTLGCGGFLLHPYCEGITQHYQDKYDLVYYHNQKEMLELIEYYTADIESAIRIRENGRATTFEKHTYIHRCREMINIVKRYLC